jgi:hypothetical protein
MKGIIYVTGSGTGPVSYRMVYTSDSRKILSQNTSVPPAGHSVPLEGLNFPPAGHIVPPAQSSVPLAGTRIPPVRPSVPRTRTRVPPAGPSVPRTRTGVPPAGPSVPRAATTVPPADNGYIDSSHNVMFFSQYLMETIHPRGNHVDTSVKCYSIGLFFFLI